MEQKEVIRACIEMFSTEDAASRIDDYIEATKKLIRQDIENQKILHEALDSFLGRARDFVHNLKK